jgi:hypothetical protein
LRDARQIRNHQALDSNIARCPSDFEFIALLVAECHIELEASDNSSAPVNVDQPQTIGALSLAASCLGGHFHDRAAGMPIHPTKIRKNNPMQSSSLRKSSSPFKGTQLLGTLRREVAWRRTDGSKRDEEAAH